MRTKKKKSIKDKMKENTKFIRIGEIATSTLVVVGFIYKTGKKILKKG